MAQAQHALDLSDVARQYHQHRCGAVRRETVTFVGLEFFLLMQDLKLGQLLLQGQQ
ncbi:hypothetical protein D3C76_1654090 [compost metagenome]